MPLKTKVEVRFGKWFSADAWKRTPKDCKEGSANAPPDASHFQSPCKRRLTRSHRDTETIYGWGPAPDPKAGQSQAIDWREIIFYTLHLLPVTSDKITGFYRIDRIFLISNPANHDNPVILSKKHRSYPHLHSRAERGRRATRPIYTAKPMTSKSSLPCSVSL